MPGVDLSYGCLDDKVEQIGCARFEFGSVIVYSWADDVTPIYPAGTILHVINWHDNSVSKNNPDPKNWVGNGNRTIDEMGFSWINYYNLTDREYKQILEARKAAQQKKVTTVASAQPLVRDTRVAPPPARRRAPQVASRGESMPLPTNVPLFTPRRPPPGLSVAVIVYRGPAPVTFDPDGFTRVKDGEVVVKAIFSQPGTYVLQAIASDGMLRTTSNMTVTVGQP